MAASDAGLAHPQPPTEGIERWRRRSRRIRLLRVALPTLIGLMLLGLAGSVAYNTFTAATAPPKDSDEPIRLLQFRLVGRDTHGRAFVITANSATRDPRDYQRVVLDHPTLVADSD